MALPAQFLEELRARTPLPALIGRRVKLARSGRQWKGCCPFHGEKTPSFYVYNDHYHCFGCGVHGDAISFVMQSQGAEFMEAVELLAREAGLDVPKPTPEAARAETRRHDIGSALAAVAARFRARLFAPEGARALAYLRGRGLADATIEKFGLGWSGEGRGGLLRELAAQDISPALLLEAGVLRTPDDGAAGGAPRELFYNRVMFPIADRRGRIISFGGRILGDGQPKYVNGPETPVFSKRRTLYGLHLAREGTHAGERTVVVEGYMDVIALHQAGFTGAVAPLGTALTEEQLAELWRLSPAPILCFDGDAAGARAAARAAELALPHLTPEQTIRLARMPQGEDPDSLVRAGANRFADVLAGAVPIADALYDLLREATGDATPEQRAALRTRLQDAASRIQNKALAGEYRRSLLDRFFASRKPAGGKFPPGRFGNGKFGRPEPVRAITGRPTPDARVAAAERRRTLIAILLNHPGLLHDVDEALGTLDLPAPLDALRHAMTAWLGATLPDDSQPSEVYATLDSASLMAHLSQSGLADAAAQALAGHPYPLPACARPGAMPAEAEAGWWHVFGLMHPDRLDDEIAEAQRLFAERPAEAQRRLVLLCDARDAMRRGEMDEKEPAGAA